MLNDFEMIVKKLPESTKSINLYPIGDSQVGSANFSEKLFINWRNRVLADPLGYVPIVGDMFNNGIKASKTNTYREKMMPSEAKQWLVRELRPIRDRIIGANTGNHELRSVNAVDDCPLYDVMCQLEIPELYRENMVFLKINLGKRAVDRQVSYSVVLGHGVSKSKTKKFITVIDGVDVMITGHTHDAESTFPAKIVIDAHNEVVKTVGFKHIIVPSFDLYGGYALRDMYAPLDGTMIPVIHLDGTKKKIEISWIQEEV